MMMVIVDDYCLQSVSMVCIDRKCCWSVFNGQCCLTNVDGQCCWSVSMVNLGGQC